MISCLSSGGLKLGSLGLVTNMLNLTLLTQWQKSFFAVIGRTDKPCFKFKSPYIPSSAFECSGCKGSLEERSVLLASRSFGRTGCLLSIAKQPILLGNKVSNHDGCRSKQSLAERQRKIENNIIYHMKLTYNKAFCSELQGC